MTNPPDPLLAALRKLLSEPQYEAYSHPDPPPGIWHGNIRDLWTTLALDSVKFGGVIEQCRTPRDLVKELESRSTELYAGGVMVVIDHETVTIEREDGEWE